jgi:hypothetical protein
MEGNLETFLSYFADFSVRHVDIPSRLHSVEKFYLAEVLAMTGYMPSSNFGGMFFPSTQFDNRCFDSFPPVGQFGEETGTKTELPSIRTAPDLTSMMEQPQTSQQASAKWGRPFPAQPPTNYVPSHVAGSMSHIAAISLSPTPQKTATLRRYVRYTPAHLADSLRRLLDP